MNSTQNTSSDWMFVISGLLVATLIAAIVSPQAEPDTAVRGDYGVEQTTAE